MKTTIYTLLLIIITLPSFSKNIYVSPSGNDLSLTPTDINTPLRTFSAACSLAVAGDIVYFRGGVYSEKWINLFKSGLPNNYIEFRNYGSEVPIFDGGNLEAYFILVDNLNYIKINGLHFRKLIGRSHGIKVTGTSHHIEIKNCHFSELYFSNNPSEIPTSTQTFNPIVFCGSNNTTAMTNIVVENCQIYNCRTGYSEALTLVGNINGFRIANNAITNTGNIGIVAAGYYNWCNSSPNNSQARNGIISDNTIDNCNSPVAIAAGIYIDGAKDVIVERNIAKNGQRGFQINCENHHAIAGAKAENVIIRNNLAINNSRGGIGIGTCYGDSDCKNGIVVNAKITNNTLINNYKNVMVFGRYEDFGELNLMYSVNTIIRNNILYSSLTGRSKLQNGWTAIMPVNLSSDYNIWFNTSNTNPEFMFHKVSYMGLNAYKASGKETNSKFANPNFIDSSNNFRLNGASSPAFDFSDPALVSIDSAGTVDLDRKTRMKNLLPDTGAYEVQCISTNISINSALTYKKYVFETNGTIFINKPINNNTQVTFNAKKSINFHPGFSKLAGTYIVTKTDGCLN
jgi:hypothetical protein